MQIKLPVDLDRFVRAKMASGRYASVDALVAEALSVMRHVEQVRAGADDDLRREIDLGLDDIEHGRVSAWDVEELKEYIRRNAKVKAKTAKKKAS